MEVRREFEHVTVIYEQLAARLNQIELDQTSFRARSLDGPMVFPVVAKLGATGALEAHGENFH